MEWPSINPKAVLTEHLIFDLPSQSILNAQPLSQRITLQQLPTATKNDCRMSTRAQFAQNFWWSNMGFPLNHQIYPLNPINIWWFNQIYPLTRPSPFFLGYCLWIVSNDLRMIGVLDGLPLGVPCTPPNATRGMSWWVKSASFDGLNIRFMMCYLILSRLKKLPIWKFKISVFQNQVHSQFHDLPFRR